MRISHLFILLFTLQPAMAALNLKQVAKGIYVHQGVIAVPSTHNHDEIANIGFIVGKQCVAVIDSGGNPKQGAMLKQAIKKITKIKICFVINTHVHPDHILGNRAFESIPNIQFVGHKKLARAMAVRGAFYIARSKEQIGIKLSAKDLIAPTIAVKNTLRLDLGGRILILTAHSTAHTDNDLTVFDEATNTMWLSDLLFIHHLPVLDGSLKGWLAEMEKLEKKQFDVVIPGHGAIDRNWPKGMQAQKKYLQKLAQKLRLKIKQGIFIENVLKNIDESIAEGWLLFNDFHKKNLSSAYAELEWED
jgi:quinoprotein relay system zinc metallohydrolase 2